MKFALFLTSLALACGASLPARAQQILLPDQSEITFVSRQMGVPVAGRFQTFSAQLSFDPARPAESSVVLTVDTGSATLGVKETDAQLPQPVWFNVPQFPQATFTSAAIKAAGDDKPGRYEVAGALALKGVTQDVVVPVMLTQTQTPGGTLTTATGTFTLKRLAFKIGENEWADTSMVADEVQVRFKLVLTGLAALAAH